MRKIRYAVAMSLDGYIAGPKGEADWIVMDPQTANEYFTAFLADFDTVVIGRRTWELMTSGNAQATGYPGLHTYVLSKSLTPSAYPNVTVLGEDGLATIAALREKPGKDIWLFGGGTLFGCFAAAGIVDTVEVGVFPVLLGAGIPLMSGCSNRVHLELLEVDRNPVGCLGLRYAVVNKSFSPREKVARAKREPGRAKHQRRA